jgi:radical SAM superfamily enzyme YgiQ (UPF0313 family)
LQKCYRAAEFPDLTDAPISRWDLTKYDAYPIFNIQTGRGCPFDCEFCSVQLFNGRQFRHKSIDRVIEEIKFLKKLDPKKPYFFIDDNILSIKEYAESLFRKLAPLNIRFFCQASVAGLNDDNMLDLMYKAGCREIFVGFESVSQESLESMHKARANKAGEYKAIIDKVHSYRMDIFGSFMFGSDSDDDKIFKATSDFIEEVSMPFAMINIITPPPGTKLYERLEREGRIVERRWWKYNSEYAVFEPGLLSRQELQQKRDKFLNEIYSYERLWGRLERLNESGVYIRKDRKTKGKGLSLGGVLMCLKGLVCKDPFDLKKAKFLLKFLFSSRPVSAFAIAYALNFHDFAATKQGSL